MYIDAPQRRLAMATITSGENSTTTIQYLHPDNLGSAHLTTNQQGEPSYVNDEYVYGGPRINQSLGGSKPTKTFTGKELDADGLYYFGARYYDPSLVRFTSIDPVSLNLTQQNLDQLTNGKKLDQVLADPRLLHPYSYAANNPTKYIDENGNIPALIPALILGAFAAWDIYDAYKATVNPSASTGERMFAYGMVALDVVPGMGLVSKGGRVVKIGVEGEHLISGLRAILKGSETPWVAAKGLSVAEQISQKFTQHGKALGVKTVEEFSKLADSVHHAVGDSAKFFFDTKERSLVKVVEVGLKKGEKIFGAMPYTRNGVPTFYDIMASTIQSRITGGRWQLINPSSASSVFTKFIFPWSP